MIHLARKRATVWLVAALLIPAGASAQSAPPTIVDMALLWVTGEYTAAAICQLPDGPRRVARNMRIRTSRRREHRASRQLEVDPIGALGAHCINELGTEEPEVQANLRFSYRGTSRPDTAKRDFEHTLRKEGGFVFGIDSGIVIVGYGDEARRVELRGGTLSIVRIPKGSDAARMLGKVGDLPKRTLTLEAPDGTRLVFHAVHIVPNR